jgi:AcrR family transcriptional regulator
MSARPRLLFDDALLDAAAKVLRREGARTTTDAIAREAGVSKALLFTRYASKADLIAAVIDRETRLPEALLEEVRDAGGTPTVETLVEIGLQLLAVLRCTIPFAELARSSLDSSAMIRALERSGAAPWELAHMCTRYFKGALGQQDSPAPAIVARVFLGAILERALSESTPTVGPAAESDRAFLDGLARLVLQVAAGQTKRDPGHGPPAPGRGMNSERSLKRPRVDLEYGLAGSGGDSKR